MCFKQPVSFYVPLGDNDLLSAVSNQVWMSYSYSLVRRGGHHAGQLEEDHSRRDPVGEQGVGRPGCVERRLLPDTQGPHRRGHVSWEGRKDRLEQEVDN